MFYWKKMHTSVEFYFRLPWKYTLTSMEVRLNSMEVNVYFPGCFVASMEVFRLPWKYMLTFMEVNVHLRESFFLQWECSDLCL